MGAARRVQEADRGAAAVEFGLVLLPLTLIVLGIISYGMMLSFRQSISQSAAEGARAGALSIVTANQIPDAAQAVSQAIGSGITCVQNGASYVLQRGGQTVGSCTPTIAFCKDAAGNNLPNQCVSVTVTYDYKNHPVGAVFGNVVPMPSTLTYTAVAQVNN